MAYAEKTSVSVSRTKADIEDLIQRYGADQFVSGYKDDIAVIGFSMVGRQVRFLLPLPNKRDREYWYTPGRGYRRTEDAAHAAWEQACRSRWRALYLIVKAKLEAVEAGISTVSGSFFMILFCQTDVLPASGWHRRSRPHIRLDRCRLCCRCSIIERGEHIFMDYKYSKRDRSGDVKI